MEKPEEETKVVQRKPRRTGITKWVRRWIPKLMSYGIPIAKYSLVPGLILYAVRYTEPTPSVWELINPWY